MYAQDSGISPSITFYLLAILNAASVFGRISPNFFADYIGNLNLMIFMCTGAGIMSFSVLAQTRLVDRSSSRSSLASSRAVMFRSSAPRSCPWPPIQARLGSGWEWVSSVSDIGLCEARLTESRFPRHFVCGAHRHPDHRCSPRPVWLLRSHHLERCHDPRRQCVLCGRDLLPAADQGDVEGLSSPATLVGRSVPNIY